VGGVAASGFTNTKFVEEEGGTRGKIVKKRGKSKHQRGVKIKDTPGMPPNLCKWVMRHLALKV